MQRSTSNLMLMGYRVGLHVGASSMGLSGTYWMVSSVL